jgi:hypothetical protein
VLACELLVRIEELERRLESGVTGMGERGQDVIVPRSAPKDKS